MTEEVTLAVLPTKEVAAVAATMAVVQTEVVTPEVAIQLTSPLVEEAVEATAVVVVACMGVPVELPIAITKATGKEALERARSRALTTRFHSARTSLTVTASMATLALSPMVIKTLEAETTLEEAPLPTLTASSRCLTPSQHLPSPPHPWAVATSQSSRTPQDSAP